MSKALKVVEQWYVLCFYKVMVCSPIILHIFLLAHIGFQIYFLYPILGISRTMQVAPSFCVQSKWKDKIFFLTTATIATKKILEARQWRKYLAQIKLFNEVTIFWTISWLFTILVSEAEIGRSEALMICQFCNEWRASIIKTAKLPPNYTQNFALQQRLWLV